MAIFASAGIGYLKGQETERHSAAPRQYSESAKSYASRACAGLEPAAMFECVEEAVERSTEAAHSEQDLKAQQDSAFSATWMLVVSLGGSLIGATGLWFLYRTLEETRKTAKAAVDQHRPWLKFEEVNVTELSAHVVTNRPGNRTSVSMTVNVKIKNVGNTPAVNIKWRPAIWLLDARVGPNFDLWQEVWTAAIESFEQRWNLQRQGEVLFPDDEPMTGSFGTNSGVLRLRGMLEPDLESNEPVKIFGVVAVRYEITSGEFAITSVPFIINVPSPGENAMAYFRQFPDVNPMHITVTRLRHGERAT